MPVKKHAIKALKVDIRRAKENASSRKAMKAAIKVVTSTKAKDNKKASAKVQSLIDKAVKNGVIHKNKAARLNSRLAKTANSQK